MVSGTPLYPWNLVPLVDAACVLGESVGLRWASRGVSGFERRRKDMIINLPKKGRTGKVRGEPALVLCLRATADELPLDC